MKQSGDNESGGNLKKSSVKDVEVVWAYDTKRGAHCRKEGDGRYKGEGGEEDLGEDGWTVCGMI